MLNLACEANHKKEVIPNKKTTFQPNATRRIKLKKSPDAESRLEGIKTVISPDKLSTVERSVMGEVNGQFTILRYHAISSPHLSIK